MGTTVVKQKKYFAQKLDNLQRKEKERKKNEITVSICHREW